MDRTDTPESDGRGRKDRGTTAGGRRGDRTGTGRRAVLAALAGATVGLAGCSTFGGGTDDGPDPDGPLVRETNARGRFRDSGEVVDRLGSLDGWEVTAGSATVDGSTALLGERSIRAGGSVTTVLSTSAPSIDFTAVEPSVAVRFEGPASVANSCGVGLTDENGNEAYYAGTVSGPSGWIQLNDGVATVDDGFDRAAVAGLDLFVDSENADVTAYLDALRVHPRPDRGRCVLTFDDATVSHYEKAFPVLEEFGFAGFGSIPTAYLENDDRLDMLANVAPSDRDPLTIEQLREMQDAGWEFGAEMYSHSETATLDRETVRTEARDAKRWLRDNDFTRERAYVTYPYGSYDRNVLEVAADYYAMGRTVNGGLNRATLTDPLHVNGHGLYTSTHEETKALIDRAERHDQALVINVHGIDEYAWKEMRLEDFRDTMAYLADSDLAVTTYSEWWAELPELHGK